MRALAVSVVAMASVFVVGSASAQTATSPEWTVSLGYAQLINDYSTLSAATARVGAKFDKNWGVEGEASVGLGTDLVTGVLLKEDVELKYDAAAYAVGYLPVTDRFQLFARLGYGTAKYDTQYKGKKISGKPHGEGESINYGLGANYYFTQHSGVRADWTRRDNVDTKHVADVFTVSYTHRF